MCFSKDNSTLILQQKAERKKSEKWERTTVWCKMPNFIPENGKNCRNLEEKNNHSGDKKIQKNTKEKVNH